MHTLIVRTACGARKSFQKAGVRRNDEVLMQSQHVVLLKDLGKSGGTKCLLIGDHLDQASHVGEEIALVAVRKE